MAVEITSDTVVKILVRRGLETERKNITLTEGELGYSVDTQRLFIGDGYTVGGNAVGNKNFGVIADKSSILSYLQTGDVLIENNLPLFYNNGTFSPFAPVVYIDPINSMNTIEYVGAPYNSLRLPTDTIGDGFVLDYSVGGNGLVNNTLQQKYGQINFDGRYISLCASANSFYIGNIFNKKVSNNLNATLNVDQDIYVNDTNTNPYQIQIYAKDPAATSNSLIEAISGGLILKGKASSGLLVAGSTSTQPQLLVKNNGEKCMKCGWCEKNPITNKVPIELEHKDGNSENNNLDNLELLCPNCHSLTSTYKALNKGNGRHKRRERYKEGKSY